MRFSDIEIPSVIEDYNAQEAIASTSAENSERAMVVGVAAAAECRGKSYASAMVSALCKDCFEREKSISACFIIILWQEGYITG